MLFFFAICYLCYLVGSHRIDSCVLYVSTISQFTFTAYINIYIFGFLRCVASVFLFFLVFYLLNARRTVQYNSGTFSVLFGYLCFNTFVVRVKKHIQKSLVLLRSLFVACFHYCFAFYSSFVFIPVPLLFACSLRFPCKRNSLPCRESYTFINQRAYTFSLYSSATKRKK